MIGLVALPRALCGPVRCMARPARPEREIALAREAARIVTMETGIKAAQPLARQIAMRVVSELLMEIDGLTTDPFLGALQKVRNSPFVALATCPDIDAASEYVNFRVARLRARSGRFLTGAEQQAERQAVRQYLCDRLAGRYARHLR